MTKKSIRLLLQTIWLRGILILCSNHTRDSTTGWAILEFPSHLTVSRDLSSAAELLEHLLGNLPVDFITINHFISPSQAQEAGTNQTDYAHAIGPRPPPDMEGGDWKKERGGC